jgi:hypothetical protein
MVSLVIRIRDLIIYLIIFLSIVLWALNISLNEFHFYHLAQLNVDILALWFPGCGGLNFFDH